MKRIAILGGGISGLSLAHFLQRAVGLTNTKAEVLVLEQAKTPGGWIRTLRNGVFQFEAGPRGFRPSRNGAEVLHLVEQLHLQDQVRAVDRKGSARMLLRHGQVEVGSVLSGYARSWFHLPYAMRTEAAVQSEGSPAMATSSSGGVRCAA